MSWKIVYSPNAHADWKHLQKSGREIISGRIKELLLQLEQDPWRNPPPFKHLQGELIGLISRRINLKHRLIYQIISAERIVRVESLWGHFT